MYFEQFYLGCLAHASYMIASGGEAIVVDPQRDVDMYLEAADEHGLEIRHIFETHLHADFVSGHRELAALTGAKIYVGASAGATFPHVPVGEGSELRIGSLRITILETPGHTPESICLVISDEEKSREPWAVITGDTLFIGDVGRPDLSATHTPAQLAGLLYDSLHNKIFKLADDVLVYPAHGAGSLCGRNMRTENSSTIGVERRTNYALQISDRDEFVRQLTSNLPARPEYFMRDAEINRVGAGSLSELPELAAIPPIQFASVLDGDSGVVALDVRPGPQFASGHVPGSVHIALGGQFASWAGTVLGLSARLVLIAESLDQVAEARMRLARVGIEDVLGYLAGGIEAWKQAGMPAASLLQISAETLGEWQKENAVRVLDVRRESELHAAGHIEGALWAPLDKFKTALPELDRNALITVHCKGGYRSLIACSLLRRVGFRNVVDLSGGFDAWQAANMPVVNDHLVQA